MGRKSVRKGTNVNEALLLPEKTEGWNWKKTLQISGAARKSRKRPTLVVGKKPNGNPDEHE
jgi:hypothetical protein